MKKPLFIILSMLISFAVYSQDEAPCIPDSIYLDSIGIIFPAPFDAVDSTGGINKPGCIGMDYDFTFTMIIPPVFVLNGFPVTLSRVTMDTIGAIDSLPLGLSYSCLPGNCDFKPNVLSCIRIHGVPLADNDPGSYNLKISFQLTTGIGVFPEVFPNPLLAPGTYSLEIHENGNENCLTSSVVQQITPDVSMKNFPNPFDSDTRISVMSDDYYDAKIVIFNNMGQVIESDTWKLSEGINTRYFENRNLTPGIYYYTLHLNQAQVTNKMIVQRR